MCIHRVLESLLPKVQHSSFELRGGDVNQDGNSCGCKTGNTDQSHTMLSTSTGTSTATAIIIAATLLNRAIAQFDQARCVFIL